MSNVLALTQAAFSGNLKEVKRLIEVVKVDVNGLADFFGV